MGAAWRRRWAALASVLLVLAAVPLAATAPQPRDPTADLLAAMTGAPRPGPAAAAAAAAVPPAQQAGGPRLAFAGVDQQAAALLKLREAVDTKGVLAKNWTAASGTAQGYCRTWAGVACGAGPPGLRLVTSVVLTSLSLEAQAVGTVGPKTAPVVGLVGTLPPASVLKPLAGLSVLDIDGQPGVRGPLPVDWSTFTQLQGLDLSNNALTGGLPLAWSSLKALTTVYLQGNALTGPLPASWPSGMTSLQDLSLAGNPLRATLSPAWVPGFRSLRILHLEGTGLTGPLPITWGTMQGGMGSLEMLSLSSNALVGTLPPFIGLQRLSSLLLQHNRLTGPLPAAWGGNLPALQSLSLAANSLEGPLPAEWSSLTRLRQLWLGGNAGLASKALPSSWGALASLEELSLRNTSISGTIPASWGGMRQLRVLQLSPGITGCAPRAWAATLGGPSRAEVSGASAHVRGFC